MAVKLLVVGPRGKMGRALIECAVETPDIEVVGAVGPKGRDYIGVDLGLLMGLGRPLGARVSDDIYDIIRESDTVIECTLPAVSMQVLNACLEHGRAFVTGTTGFSSQQTARLEQAGATIPVLHASNGSPIVHLLYDLVGRISQTVGTDADIDIIEMHANTKLDAPSGTAIEIGQVISESVGIDLEESARYDGSRIGNRESDAIYFTSVRSGGTPSTHRVVFGFENERLELTHYAYNAGAFAKGLIQGALFISGKSSGHYGLEEVFGDT